MPKKRVLVINILIIIGIITVILLTNSVIVIVVVVIITLLNFFITLTTLIPGYDYCCLRFSDFLRSCCCCRWDLCFQGSKCCGCKCCKERICKKCNEKKKENENSVNRNNNANRNEENQNEENKVRKCCKCDCCAIDRCDDCKRYNKDCCCCSNCCNGCCYNLWYKRCCGWCRNNYRGKCVNCWCISCIIEYICCCMPCRSLINYAVIEDIADDDPAPNIKIQRCKGGFPCAFYPTPCQSFGTELTVHAHFIVNILYIIVIIAKMVWRINVKVDYEECIKHSNNCNKDHIKNFWLNMLLYLLLMCLFLVIIVINCSVGRNVIYYRVVQSSKSRKENVESNNNLVNNVSNI